jgi:hypothetical protein
MVLPVKSLIILAEIGTTGSEEHVRADALKSAGAIKQQFF